MGERWKQMRAASFTHQQDAAYERELKKGTLFSRTAKALERTFSCTGSVPVANLVGTHVLLKPCGGAVSVIHGNAEIGCVIGDDAAEVALAIDSEPHCPGMALAVVEDAASVTGEFAVRIVDHTEEE
jgi:hypothetical protein